MVKCRDCGIKFEDDEGIFVNIVGTKQFFLCWKDFHVFNDLLPSSSPESDIPSKEENNDKD
jgi:hypothetical protein